MITLRKLLAGVTVGLVLVGAPASVAVAADPYNDVRTFWNSYGVPAAVQDSLVAELSATGTVDAAKQGAEPVSTVTRDLAGAQQTITTFADGSISVTSLERAKAQTTKRGQVSTQATIEGCRVASGSGYSNYSGCIVSADNGIFRIGFKVAYSIYNGASAKITSSGSASAASGTGTITDPTRDMWRPQSSPVQQAVVKYHSDYTAWSQGLQQDVYLGFWLTSTGGTSTSTS